MWTTVKQKGEMGYGQPRFMVPIRPEDQVANGFLTIRVDTLRYVAYRNDTIVHDTTQSERVGFRVVWFAKTVGNCRRSKKYAANHEYIQADWCSPPDKPRTSVPKSWREPWRRFAQVHPSTFFDVAEAANYFGDRLPEEFYKAYEKILVKVPQEGTQKAQEAA